MDIRQRNNVVVSGSGPDILLFANGFGCDQKVWRHVVPAFQKNFKTVTFDYAFVGPRYQKLEGYVRDILEVIDALKLQNVHYVGHSVSGMLGLLASLEKPQIFKQLMMVGPSPCYIDSPGYKGGLTREAVEGILQAIGDDFAAWAKQMGPLLMGNPDRPAFAQELVQMFLQQDPKVAATFARSIFLSDYRQVVSQCQVPVVVLQCSEDPVAPVEVGQYLRKQIRGSQLVQLQAKGHYPSLSAPEELIQVIRSFVSAEPKRKAG